jgi:hypothetical protein
VALEYKPNTPAWAQTHWSSGHDKKNALIKEIHQSKNWWVVTNETALEVHVQIEVEE